MLLIRKVHRTVLALLGFLIVSLTSAATEPVVVGVLAFRGNEQTELRWRATVDYLAQEIPGRKFELQVMDHPAIHAALLEKRIDFVLTNPEDFLLDRTFTPLVPIATLVGRAKGKALDRIGGTIVVRSGRDDIGSLADLQGKVVAAPHTESLGGYLAQFAELQAAGVSLQRGGVELLITGMPHDRVIQAVLSGKADVGFVRAGVLEDMVAEGAISASALKVINVRQHGDFPFAHSSELFPEWPFLATGRADSELVKAVTVALLKIAPDSSMAKTGGYTGFSPPADYSGVEEVMRRSRLFPGRLELFDGRDVFEKYSKELLAFLSVLLLITLFVGRHLVLSYRRALHERERRVEAELALRTSESHFRDIFSNAATGIARVALDGQWLEVNRKFLEIFGYPDAESMPSNYQALTHPDDLPADFATVERLLGGKEERAILQKRYRHQSGRYFWAHLTVSLVRTSDGAPDYFIGVVEDIQSLREAEEALARSQREIALHARRQLALQEGERKRLSLELHDELGQLLTGLNLQLAAAQDVPVVARAMAMVRDIAATVRRLAHQLRPPQLDHLGLASSVRWHLAELGKLTTLPIHFEDAIGDRRYPAEIELAAFRIFQEALTNALRHSQARDASVTLREAGDELVLTVSDNGCGFAMPDNREQNAGTSSLRLGLIGMRERAEGCGGALLVESQPGTGTSVVARFALTLAERHD